MQQSVPFREQFLGQFFGQSSFASVRAKKDFQTRYTIYFVDRRVHMIDCAQACISVKSFALVRTSLSELFLLFYVIEQVFEVNISPAFFFRNDLNCVRQNKLP